MARGRGKIGTRANIASLREWEAVALHQMLQEGLFMTSVDHSGGSWKRVHVSSEDEPRRH